MQLENTIDLSHVIKEGMPVYPGTAPPVLKNACTIEKDGFAEKELCFYSHTGTHIDSPAHILKNKPTLSDLPIETFTGMGIVLPHTSENPLSIDSIKQSIELLGNPEFVLVNTGWDKHWESKRYFSGFPLPSAEVFEFLSTLGLKGLGIDAISIDPVGSESLSNHKTMLGTGSILIENLKGLDRLIGKSFRFYCFPLYIYKGDGSPVRAVASYIK